MTSNIHRACLAGFITIISCVASAGLFAQDVSRFRGPEGSSFYTDPAFNLTTLSNGAKTLWQTKVHYGYSGVSIRGDKLYTMGNDYKNDTVYCLNADSGAVIWTYVYPCGTNEHPGPRATPTIDGDTVYTISFDGQLFALDAESGSVRWQKDLKKEYGVKLASWALGTSVLISDNLLVVNANRSGIALDKNTGNKVWAGESGTSGYATPVIFSLGGIKYAAIFGAEALYGVELATGKVIWQYPWVTGSLVNAADPLVFGNKIFIASAYKHGCALLEFSADSINLIWENKNLAAHFSSPVYIDGFIYGISGNSGSNGSFDVLNAETGALAFQQPMRIGNFIVVNGRFVIISERGELSTADVSPTGYTALASMTLKRNTYWTAPVVSAGRLYIRNEAGDLYCINMK